ncbi:MAG: hypothetical protein M3411_01070 [Chloroflexota bacterium]|nr:hypothetical protein [Chloroflexota bacterium]
MMRTWTLVIFAVIVAVGVGGSINFGSPNAGAQDCDEWVTRTNDRVNAARTLLYPPGRIDAFVGTADEAAREMEMILQDQEESSPPDGGGNLHDDLIEAMAAGVEGLSAGSAADPQTQIVFAKSIIYTADARLLTLVETC